MRIALDVLRRFTDLPPDPLIVRRWMDEVGLEVKRLELDGDRTTYTLELLANRGDHHCYDGVARELTGRTGGPLREPATAALTTGEGPWPVRVESELCLVYTLTRLDRGAGADALSAEAARLLAAAGIHPLGAAVDATNVANLELGQPTHAFDLDTVEGPITLRRSRPGERAWPLFAPEPVALPEGTLVVADERKVLAIAGVIGCEESKTTAATTRLLLESATFDPVAVRKAARALRIHTDSAARFERGADPERPLRGAGRVVHLLEQAGWSRVGATGVAGAWRNPGRVVGLQVESTNRFLGTRMPAEEIAARLERYGFRVRPDADRDGWLRVSVPSWRLWDVEFPADLHEELAKSLGYDETPIGLPAVDLGALPSPAEVRKARVEEVLLGNGFYEVFTDGFYGRDAIARLGLTEGHPLHRHVETTNALDRAYSLLKNNALHQALEAVAINERRRTLDVKMYEWTRTFHPVDALLGDRPDPARPPCTERRLLWAVVSGRDRARGWRDTSRPADAWYLKGLVEEIATELGLDLEVGPADPDHPLAGLLHPGRRAAIRLAGEPVGILGEAHPAVVRRYKLKSARPCYLEIDAAALTSDGVRPAFVEPPSTQAQVRSVALALPSGVEAGDLAAVLHAAGPDWLEQVRVVDLFELDAPGLRSVTFELSFTNPDGARSADEVNRATEAVVRATLEQFGPRGVVQR